MQLIAGSINGSYLKEILINSKKSTESVKAAIAYASGDPELLSYCLENNIKITLWCRYDHSIPVSLPILNKFLRVASPNYVCKLVPDIFHAKVIWWEGYGVYIGSANLTNNGWYGNIEAGIFLDNEEISFHKLDDELMTYFDELDNYSIPLTYEIINELDKFSQQNKLINNQLKELKDKFNKSRKIPELEPLTFISKKDSSTKRKEEFLKEWYETLQILRDISERVGLDTYRPSWINKDVPRGVQADQFLHAYYYSNVRQGNKALHYDFFETNKNDPDGALNKALIWWKSLSSAPHQEDTIINEWSIYLREKLDRRNLLNLKQDEFVSLCAKVHALRDHSLRVKYTAFGYSKKLPQMNAEQRVKLLGEFLYNQQTLTGKSILEVLDYLLYGGKIDHVPERLWLVTHNDEWKIPHLGISSLGEMIGWAMPDYYPPRNGRTSKALTALGYKVKIHSQ